MDKLMIARLVVFVLTWINSWLASKGTETLPVVSEESVAYFLTFLASVWTLWKNNYISKKGKAQRDVLEKNDLI